jgi:methyltransferase (TIGR00027 family)
MSRNDSITSPPPLIEHVSDTARWVAFHRALESERPDALFRDLFARRLAGERGQRIAEGMPALPGTYPGPRGVTWFFSVRTKVFDELILDSIQSVEAGAVLNLAAGPDARPYRMQLPESLVWIEADRAEILDAKSDVLAGGEARLPRRANCRGACRREGATASLGPGWGAHERVVVVTEGLLVYLEEGTVGSLADELREDSQGCGLMHQPDVATDGTASPTSCPSDAFGRNAAQST